MSTLTEENDILLEKAVQLLTIVTVNCTKSQTRRFNTKNIKNEFEAMLYNPTDYQVHLLIWNLLKQRLC